MLPAQPQWHIVRASVTGPNHDMRGAGNEDRSAEHTLPSGAFVLAVADGAGSASRSGNGAELAVDAAVQAAERLFGPGLPEPTDDAWRSAAEHYAHACLAIFDQRLEAESNRVLHDCGGESLPGVRSSFATTLLAVVVAQPWIAYASVGDCFLVIEHGHGHSRLVSDSVVRENAGTTTFMTSPMRDQALQWGVICDRDIRGIALCSDGLVEATLSIQPTHDGEFRYTCPGEFSRFFGAIRRRAADKAALEQQFGSAGFAASSGDDKTMVLAVREP